MAISILAGFFTLFLAIKSVISGNIDSGRPFIYSTDKNKGDLAHLVYEINLFYGLNNNQRPDFPWDRIEILGNKNYKIKCEIEHRCCQFLNI